MPNKEPQKIKIEFDLKNKIIVGESSQDNNGNNELNQKIFKSILKRLSDNPLDWISEFEEQLDIEQHQVAYDIFSKNKISLEFTKNINIIDKLERLNVDQLDCNSRKDYLLYLIGYTALLNVRKNTKYIDKLLNEFSNQLDIDLIAAIKTEKANIYAANKRTNLATIIYKEIIESGHGGAGSIAFSYQGLSLIAQNIDDRISYAERAIDKHLEAGNKSEAIKNIISISELYSATSPSESLKLIDKCISLFSTDNLINRELVASIKTKKASYLLKLGKPQEALELAEHACELRKGLIGAEEEYYATLCLAEMLSKLVHDNEKSIRYKREADVIASTIDDKSFKLRLELDEKLTQSIQLEDEFISRVTKNGDIKLLCATLICKAQDPSLELTNCIEILDNIRVMLEENDTKELLDIVYFSIAEKYRINNHIHDAYENYEKSLNINPFHHPSAQNCIAMLFSNKLFHLAKPLVKSRIDLLGELPGICFAYSRCLFEEQKYIEALKYIKKSDLSNDAANKLKLECMDKIDDEHLLIFKQSLDSIKPYISAENLYEVLVEFANSISSNSRMYFWEKDKSINEYKWTKRPEELAKQYLITFLNAKFGDDTIEIIQEPRAGAGFIDLYLLLPHGLKVVIELKMCGTGYSTSYAISGESQIIHYQENKATNLGYLVVFDSRTRDFGKGLRKLSTYEKHTIYNVVVDVRNKIDKNPI
jgi:tetratricopeptide (TPR) repeat protein